MIDDNMSERLEDLGRETFPCILSFSPGMHKLFQKACLQIGFVL